jgi:6-phosphogluconate dehydrogenase
MAQSFGVIGLAVMGENLALNVERNGFPVAVYNRSREKTDRFMAERAGDKNVKATYSLEDFVASLERPRRILVMVKAGGPVDAVIGQLKPLLEAGDMIIDGGNSLYEDTERRVKEPGTQWIGLHRHGGERRRRRCPQRPQPDAGGHPRRLR